MLISLSLTEMIHLRWHFHFIIWTIIFTLLSNHFHKLYLCLLQTIKIICIHKPDIKNEINYFVLYSEFGMCIRVKLTRWVTHRDSWTFKWISCWLYVTIADYLWCIFVHFVMWHSIWWNSQSYSTNWKWIKLMWFWM